MESIWDYIMRRKPVFLSYFAVFFISGVISCQLLNNLLDKNTISDPAIVQETPADSLEYRNFVLSPQAVAGLEQDNLSAISTAPVQLIHIDIVDPETPAQIATQDSTANLADVEVPLTAAPRRVSIFRTVLAVLLAVTSLTLAGLGLYQTYAYFRL